MLLTGYYYCNLYIYHTTDIRRLTINCIFFIQMLTIKKIIITKVEMLFNPHTSCMSYRKYYII